jgi:hypothetical protein
MGGGPATAGERATQNGNDFVTGYTLGLIGGVRSWVSFFLVRLFFYWERWFADMLVR